MANVPLQIQAAFTGNQTIQLISQLGLPNGGTYAGYLLLAKAYVGGFQALSEVCGTFYLSRGSTGTGNRGDQFIVVSKSSYNSEGLIVQVQSGGGRYFSRTVKVTYGGVVYHAIETSVSGGEPHNGVTFNGILRDASPIYVDASYVSNIAAFGTSSVFDSGTLESKQDYKGLTFVKLTTPTVYTATYSGQTDVTINVSSTFGVPSNAKALALVGYYHVTGYSIGTVGQGDHSMSMFRFDNGWSSATPWSFNTSTNTGWGEFVMYHDGDTSETGDLHYYGAWTGNGICGVNANGNIYGRLGWGYSGGTHYNSVWCWGYWI